jgi:hypothetical protein
MGMRSRLPVVLALLVLPVSAGDQEPRAKRPRLDLRATPRMAFSPVTVFFTAELNGGDDVEEYYCPEREWEWGDGGKSVHEADCPPFDDDTRIERRFTAEHEYRRAGNYQIRLLLRREGRVLAVASVKVAVRPGLGSRRDD